MTTERGRATLFAHTAEGRVRQQQLRLADNVLSPVVSRDGQRIAYLREYDGVVFWHDVTPSGKQLVGPAHQLQTSETFASPGSLGGAKISAFSPDARRLVGVLGTSTSVVTMWDLDTGLPLTLPKVEAQLGTVWFGPDANTMVVTSSPSSATSMVGVDIGTGTTRKLADDISFAGAQVSGDGSVAIVCRDVEIEDPEASDKANYLAIRVADGRVLRRHAIERSCGAAVVDAKGERFAVNVNDDEWDLVDTRGDSPVQSYLGPSLSSGADLNAGLPLLGTALQPVMATTQHENAVIGWTMNRADGNAYSPPKLLGDGSTMVVRMGRHGTSLRLSETEGEQRTLAEVANKVRTPPDARQELAVNRAQTLVADVSDSNRITVRALPTLRRVADFTTAEPPPTDQDGKPGLLRFDFLDDDRLLTVSGGRVEHWDARQGHTLSQSIDLAALRLTTKAQPNYGVGRHHEPGYVAVTVQGESDVHAIDLRTGKENKALRISLGDDLVAAVFLEDTRYTAVMTTGGMMELWSARPGKVAKRVAGPFGPLKENRFVWGITGGAGYFVANGSSVRFLKADDPGFRQTCQFAEDQGFLAATKDGKAVLRSPMSGGVLGLVRFDPALWKRHLCTVLDRDLTDDERGSLPGGLPTEICPP